MSNIINPLQNLIDQATKIPPSGALEEYAQRINGNPSGCSIMLLDVSGSMGEITHEKRHIDILREALNRPLQPTEIAIAFNSSCHQLNSLQSIPEPSGGTALHLAIIEAASLNPRHTLIVPDGIPDYKKQALAAVKNLPGIISTLFIGDDSDTDAIAFMSKLARVGCGKSAVCDIRKLENQQNLKAAILSLLPPTKKIISC